MLPPRSSLTDCGASNARTSHPGNPVLVSLTAASAIDAESKRSGSNVAQSTRLEGGHGFDTKVEDVGLVCQKLFQPPSSCTSWFESFVFRMSLFQPKNRDDSFTQVNFIALGVFFEPGATTGQPSSTMRADLLLPAAAPNREFRQKTAVFGGLFESLPGFSSNAAAFPAALQSTKRSDRDEASSEPDVEVTLTMGASPVTNSEFLAIRSVADWSMSRTVKFVPRKNVRSKRTRVVSTGFPPFSTTVPDTRNADVHPARLPRSVNEQLRMANSSTVASIRIKGADPEKSIRRGNQINAVQ